MVTASVSDVASDPTFRSLSLIPHLLKSHPPSSSNNTRVAPNASPFAEVRVITSCDGALEMGGNVTAFSLLLHGSYCDTRQQMHTTTGINTVSEDPQQPYSTRSGSILDKCISASSLISHPSHCSKKSSVCARLNGTVRGAPDGRFLSLSYPGCATRSDCRRNRISPVSSLRELSRYSSLFPASEQMNESAETQQSMGRGKEVHTSPLHAGQRFCGTSASHRFRYITLKLVGTGKEEWTMTPLTRI